MHDKGKLQKEFILPHILQADMHMMGKMASGGPGSWLPYIHSLKKTDMNVGPVHFPLSPFFQVRKTVHGMKPLIFRVGDP